MFTVSALLWIYLAILIALIILAIVAQMTIKAIETLHLKNAIQTLWNRKAPLESFIRPNHLYDHLYLKHLKQDSHQDNQYIDDKTWSDLDLDELFQQLNFNFSAIGEMRLFATLRGMYAIEDEQLIETFKKHRSFREFVSLKLAQIGKSVYPKYPDEIQTIPRQTLHMLSPIFPFIGLIVIPFSVPLGGFIAIAALIYNVFLSSKLKKSFEDELNSMYYTSNVLKRARAISLHDEAPQLDVNFSHFKTARYLSGIVGSASGADEAAMLSNVIKSMFNLDYVLFHLIQQSFKEHEDEVLACYDYIGMMDNHYSIALWRETLDTQVKPETTDQPTIDFDGIIHPLLPDAVPNDLNIQQHILLTGSNASGKSTFMKAVAINLILAQYTNTALADRFVCKPGHIYTSMANQDDVMSGDSYFMAEIKSVRRLFNLPSDHFNYCFIDEIFKGTNTTERVAASDSVLAYLAAYDNYRILAATHDIELAEWLQQQYANYHFNEDIQDDKIHFDYKIKKGKANTRNAIELLRITNFPERVYSDAKANTKKLEES